MVREHLPEEVVFSKHLEDGLVKEEPSRQTAASDQQWMEGSLERTLGAILDTRLVSLGGHCKNFGADFYLDGQERNAHGFKQGSKMIYFPFKEIMVP